MRVEALVEELLRPLVEADGGEVTILSVESERVVLQLSGACMGCPGIHYTRSEVIEPLFKSELGAKVHVEVINNRTTGNHPALPPRDP